MKNIILGFLFLLSIVSCSKTEKIEAASEGPQNGSLIIVGGNLSHPDIYKKFLELSGGAEAPIVIIVTSADDETLENPDFIKNTKNRFANHGFQNITVLHTRNPEVANSDSFVNPIKNAKGLWFTGGRQWRLVDSYAGTKTYDELLNLLNRGGVIGGSSAGASIQGSFLVRGDTKTNTVMMGDHQEGFSFLKNVAIDQHLLAMNRQYDIFEILDTHPELLGIGLDENTAIVVQKNAFEVIGEHYVAIYDKTYFAEIRDKEDWSKVRYEQIPLPEGSRKFYLLKKGDRYDLMKRRVITE